jgi:hypothetical protein
LQSFDHDRPVRGSPIRSAITRISTSYHLSAYDVFRMARRRCEYGMEVHQISVSHHSHDVCRFIARRVCGTAMPRVPCDHRSHALQATDSISQSKDRPRSRRAAQYGHRQTPFRYHRRLVRVHSHARTADRALNQDMAVIISIDYRVITQ